ncbi:MAG TPA: phosphatase PAP2 family protein [Jatrophihabitantaceae bacterium]|nr:phosphatase PAP2 family protein [Jatrophihabitantaceae bacterium]
MLAGSGVRVLRAVHAVGWHRIRIACAVAYFGLLAFWFVAEGVPTDRKQLSYLVVIGLAISCLGRGWRRLLWVVIDWLPFTLVLMFYDSSRALADTMGMPLHEQDIEQAERWLFGGVDPSVWLQAHLYTPLHVHWYDALATLIYTSHFVVTPVLAAVLWLRQRQLWLRYISRVIVLSFAGLATYILFPEAPPWLAARDGYLPPIARLSARGWEYVHAGFAHRLLVAGQNGGSNPVAAMPSLHFGFSLLAALFVAGLLRSRWRLLLYIYPLLMGLTLVYTGEHYVLDLIFGGLYAGSVHLALIRSERWWQERRLRRTAIGPMDTATELTPAG